MNTKLIKSFVLAVICTGSTIPTEAHANSYHLFDRIGAILAEVTFDGTSMGTGTERYVTHISNVVLKLNGTDEGLITVKSANAAGGFLPTGSEQLAFTDTLLNNFIFTHIDPTTSTNNSLVDITAAHRLLVPTDLSYNWISSNHIHPNYESDPTNVLQPWFYYTLVETPTTVPLPAPIALFGMSLFGFAASRIKKHQA